MITWWQNHDLRHICFHSQRWSFPFWSCAVWFSFSQKKFSVKSVDLHNLRHNFISRKLFLWIIIHQNVFSPNQMNWKQIFALEHKSLYKIGMFLISLCYISNFITEFGPKNWSLNNHSVGQAELYNQNPLVFQICHFRQLHSSFDWFRLNWLEMSKLPKQILKDLSTSSLLLLMTMIQKKVIVEKNR